MLAPVIRDVFFSMRRLLIVAASALGLAFVGLVPAALGFGTLNTLGQNAEHEHITRAALTDFGARTLNELAGETGTFGAVGAPDNPLRGLLVSSEAHCDNADYYDADPSDAAAPYAQSEAQSEAALTRCREWIVQRLEAAVRAAEPLSHPNRLNTSLGCVFNGAPGRAKCTVLENLGLAFHAAQDFYSHTNWVDQPSDSPVGLENPPGLGNSGRAPWLDPRGRVPFPRGLISGCFQALPESLFCSGRIRHAALNKDTGPIGAAGATGPGTTDRGAINGNFERAVAAAIDDTRDKWRYFGERVVAAYGEENGARIICAVQNDSYRSC
jgi:hypothetical protein